MPTVQQHFDGKQQVVREIYDTLLAVSHDWGPVEEEPEENLNSSEPQVCVCRRGHR
jgi:hypothetical protein